MVTRSRGRIDLHADPSGMTVDLHPALLDQRFGVPPGTIAGIGNDFLNTNRSITDFPRSFSFFHDPIPSQARNFSHQLWGWSGSWVNWDRWVPSAANRGAWANFRPCQVILHPANLIPHRHRGVQKGIGIDPPFHLGKLFRPDSPPDLLSRHRRNGGGLAAGYVQCNILAAVVNCTGSTWEKP